MGGSSTHHIIVTKRMMARKKANRAARQTRKVTAYRGKFGAINGGMLADHYKSKRGHLIKDTDCLSATEKAYIWAVLITAVLISLGIYLLW